MSYCSNIACENRLRHNGMQNWTDKFKQYTKNDKCEISKRLRIKKMTKFKNNFDDQSQN